MLESQLAKNSLKNNGNQVSKMRMCLDVTWLPSVFPAESSDSILTLFFAFCENQPPSMARDGRAELGGTLGDCILADTAC